MLQLRQVMAISKTTDEDTVSSVKLVAIVVGGTLAVVLGLLFCLIRRWCESRRKKAALEAVLPRITRARFVLGEAGSEDRECVICLVEYGVGDDLGILPCSHIFHNTCVVDWIRRKATCPVCRASVSSGL